MKVLMHIYAGAGAETVNENHRPDVQASLRSALAFGLQACSMSSK